MAELDVKDFIIPESDLTGLYKVGESMAAVKAAKAKASQAQLPTFLKPEDYLTGTVYDPYITQKTNELLAKGIQLSQAGLDEGSIRLALMPEINKLSISSQKLKEIERKRKEGEAYFKTIPGADIKKFNDGYKQLAFYNPDGTLKDMDTVDETQEYVGITADTYPMWTNAGIDNLIGKAGTNTYELNTFVQDAKKGKRQATVEMTHPLHMHPVMKDGVFQNDFEPDYDLYTDNNVVQQAPAYNTDGTPKLDAQGKQIMEDIRLLNASDWNAIKGDYAAYQRVKQLAREAGVKDINSPEGQRQANAIAYNLFNISSKSKTGYHEKTAVTAAPAPTIKITNVTKTGGDKEDETDYRDIYQEAIDAYEDKMKKNLGGSMKVSELGEAANAIVEVANKRNPGRSEKYNASDLILIVGKKGGTYEILDNDSLETVMPFNSPQDINPYAAFGTTQKQAASKNKKSYKLSYYDATTQEAIKAYMNAKGYNEREAITKLKEAGRIK